MCRDIKNCLWSLADTAFFIKKNFFSGKLILVQKRVLLIFLTSPLPLSVIPFVLYAFPANPSLGIKGIS